MKTNFCCSFVHVRSLNMLCNNVNITICRITTLMAVWSQYLESICHCDKVLRMLRCFNLIGGGFSFLERCLDSQDPCPRLLHIWKWCDHTPRYEKQCVLFGYGFKWITLCFSYLKQNQYSLNPKLEVIRFGSLTNSVTSNCLLLV
jgi:hypothetical protein